MCNSKWFRSTPIILLLSKWDTFHNKISQQSLSICFEDYSDENHTYQHSLKFLVQKFNSVRDKGSKNVNTNIYQQFSSFDTPSDELANNLGGCIKGIRMEQREQARKARKQLELSQGEISTESSNGSNASPAKSDIKHKLFSGLLNKLKKK